MDSGTRKRSKPRTLMSPSLRRPLETKLLVTPGTSFTASVSVLALKFQISAELTLSSPVESAGLWPMIVTSPSVKLSSESSGAMAWAAAAWTSMATTHEMERSGDEIRMPTLAIF